MRRLMKFINGRTPYLCGAMFILIMLVMVADVIGRYFLNSPNPYSHDMTAQLNLMAMFWGASYIMSIDGFASVDLIYNKFSPQVRNIVDILGRLLGTVFLGVLLWQTLL